MELQTRRWYYHLDLGATAAAVHEVTCRSWIMLCSYTTFSYHWEQGQMLAPFVSILGREMGVHLHFLFPLSWESSWVTTRKLLPPQVINKSLSQHHHHPWAKSHQELWLTGEWACISTALQASPTRFVCVGTQKALPKVTGVPLEGP